MNVLKGESETYEELIEALNQGNIIQLCTINASGIPVAWHNVDEINRNFSPSRYRIIESKENEFERKAKAGFHYNDREDKWYKL